MCRRRGTWKDRHWWEERESTKLRKRTWKRGREVGRRGKEVELGLGGTLPEFSQENSKVHLQKWRFGVEAERGDKLSLSLHLVGHYGQSSSIYIYISKGSFSLFALISLREKLSYAHQCKVETLQRTSKTSQYEALYDWKHKSPIHWHDIGERWYIVFELVDWVNEALKKISRSWKLFFINKRNIQTNGDDWWNLKWETRYLQELHFYKVCPSTSSNVMWRS